MASASALRPVVHSIPPSQPSFLSSRSLAFEFGVRKCLILFSSNNNCKNLFSSNNNCRKVRALAATRREKDMDIHSASSTSSSAGARKPFGVLFVCLGNICRSPTAEAVFRKAVEKRKLESLFEIDSAGTINYHEGNPADPRMKAAAKKRGIDITSISRPIQPTDFQKFDIILAMDRQNKADIVEAFDDWKEKYALPPNALKKVMLMCNFCRQAKESEVPDPYYGGPQGFEKVLDILEDACESLLDDILERHFQDKSKHIH